MNTWAFLPAALLPAAFITIGAAITCDEQERKAEAEEVRRQLEAPCRDEVHKHSGPCPNRNHVLMVSGGVAPLVVCRCKDGESHVSR